MCAAARSGQIREADDGGVPWTELGVLDSVWDWLAMRTRAFRVEAGNRLAIRPNGLVRSRGMGAGRIGSIVLADIQSLSGLTRIHCGHNM